MLSSKGVFRMKVAERKVRQYGGKGLVVIPQVTTVCVFMALQFSIFDLWLMLALCLQEDGGAAAAGAPPLEKLHSEGESRPKEAWPSSH